MDQTVKQAIAKWPNVPHCYGWLGLDARGNWRMRDERAQRLGLAGDKIVHPALLGFIERNYTHDERGCWFFQNGPQRVYVNLESTPYIARTDPQHDFILHTGAALGPVEEIFLTDSGDLILSDGAIVAQLDDRDLAQVMAAFQSGARAVSDEGLLAWLADGASALGLCHRGRDIEVQRLGRAEVDGRFAFVRLPQPA